MTKDEAIRHKATEIAIKYVLGNHNALTDNQEIKDLTNDIVELFEYFDKKQPRDESKFRIVDHIITDKKQIADMFMDKCSMCDEEKPNLLCGACQESLQDRD